MEYTRHTVAVGLRKGNKFYLSKRLNTPNFANKWQFAGGKLEPNERPAAGGAREVEEETGLKIAEKRLKFFYPIYGDPTTYVCNVYLVELTEAEVPQRTEDVMTDWQLFTIEEALKLDLMPGLKTTLERLKELL